LPVKAVVLCKGQGATGRSSLSLFFILYSYVAVPSLHLPLYHFVMVRRQVAVIFATGGTAAALAARTATSTIPIVFYMGGDPVQQGLVASLGRPGGNLGFGWLGFALAAKRLELLRELLPNGATIGMLVNPANPDSDFEMRDVQDAARILGR
jgi:ABC-type uncharacterized transport system substrate-binding protein